MQPDSGIAIADSPSSDTSVSRFYARLLHHSAASDIRPRCNEYALRMLRAASIVRKNITVDYIWGGREGTTAKPVSEYTVWTQRFARLKRAR